MIFDWERKVDSTWLDPIEESFAKFGAAPAEGTGHSGARESHGVYNRVRRRLAEFLDEAGEDQGFSIRVRSKETDPNTGFFPSDILISYGASDGFRRACIAVREMLVDSPDALIACIGRPIFDKCGAFYGGAWDFPAAFGPDAYLASLGAIPKGNKWGENRDYTARITRWRRNTLDRKLRPRRGYFREIYPINLLLDSHLSMPFRDAPLVEFMKATGTLQPFEFNKRMHRWDVLREDLNEVRDALEPSGLVLSSEAEPLRLN